MVVSTCGAELEGPQGSAYREGVFRVKIQIPDRYPFHPPIVTFKTPIYHPNIDEGGRICLDILSLPPKGAWQPSLNISTVLMSIGLLLSEPNPDDGLAHEASREYKYNRQAFDQKARSWTEKYAKTTKICGTAEANDNLPGDPVPCLVQGGMEEADGIPINMPQEIDGTKNLYKNSHGSIPDSSSSVFTTGDRKELETAGLRCHRQRCLSLSQSEGGLSIKHVHKEKIQEVECHQNQDLGNRRLKLSLSLSRNEIGSSKSVLGKPESKNAFSENQMQVQLSCEDAKMGVPIRKIEKIDGLKLPSPSSSRQSKKRGQLYSMAIVPDSDSDEEQNVKPPAKLRLSLNRGK